MLAEIASRPGRDTVISSVVKYLFIATSLAFLAALLFGTLRNGATRMQSIASIPIDIISIVQAMVIVFIAAPAIVRWIYRVPIKAEGEGTVFTRGWGA